LPATPSPTANLAPDSTSARRTNDVSVRSPRSPRPSERRPGVASRWLVGSLLLACVLVAILSLVPGPWLRALLPLLAVAGLRASDVTLGVFRATFIVRGRMAAAAVAAAAEAGVWLAAAGIVLTDLTLVRGIAFAAGVGLGTTAGMLVVRWLRLGMVTVRIFAPATRGEQVATLVRTLGHGVTVFDGRGRDGDVAMLLSVVRRRESAAICRFLADHPDLFVTLDSEPGPNSNVSGIAGRI
jgi:uncharacterized protein YebE (UPF0316 family)